MPLNTTQYDTLTTFSLISTGLEYELVQFKASAAAACHTFHEQNVSAQKGHPKFLQPKEINAFSEALNGENSSVLGIIKDGQIVAQCIIAPVRAETLDACISFNNAAQALENIDGLMAIQSVSIKHDQKGTGLSTVLISEALSAIYAQGKNAIARVAEGNLPSKKLFTNVGFEPVGTVPTHDRGAVQLMIKTLSKASTPVAQPDLDRQQPIPVAA